MSKQRIARILTLAVLVTALSAVTMRNRVWFRGGSPGPKADATPEEVIYGMLDAARGGDVAAYLGAFSGEVRKTLEQTAAEQGSAAFLGYLQQSNAAIKGVALQTPQPVTDREVKVQVEYVYQDRNEIQQMYLTREPQGWKISRVDSAERIKTLIPYGTRVE